MKSGIPEHPMVGRRRNVEAKSTEEIKPADIKAVSAKMVELMESESKVTKNFDQAELRDLKDLVFLGRMSTVVELVGYKFEITTLTNSERRMVIKELAGREGEMAAFIPACTLAMAIQTINGVALEDIYSGEDAESLTPYKRCLMVVDSWQSILVRRLYTEYEKINLGAESVFTKDEEGEDKLKK